LSTSPIIEIRWRRGTAGVLCAVAVALAAIGALVIATAAGSGWRLVVGAACVIFFALAARQLFRRAKEDRPLLVFSADGLSDPTGVFGLGNLEWDAVVEVRLGGSFPRPLRLRICLDRERRGRVSWRRAVARYLSTGSTPSTINLARFTVCVPGDAPSAIRKIAPESVAVG
jgi:hypothetical protein